MTTLWSVQTLRVRRLYDDKNNTLLYVAYSTRLDGSKNVSALQVCTLKLSWAHGLNASVVHLMPQPATHSDSTIGLLSNIHVAASSNRCSWPECICRISDATTSYTRRLNNRPALKYSCCCFKQQVLMYFVDMLLPLSCNLVSP